MKERFDFFEEVTTISPNIWSSKLFTRWETVKKKRLKFVCKRRSTRRCYTPGTMGFTFMLEAACQQSRQPITSRGLSCTCCQTLPRIRVRLNRTDFWNQVKEMCTLVCRHSLYMSITIHAPDDENPATAQHSPCHRSSTIKSEGKKWACKSWQNQEVDQ